MKRLLLIICVALISYFSLRPLFSPGYFPMHDNVQVERVVAMGRALKEGQFPVRWVSDLGYGYGYPIYNFYGPLPYYAGGILYALGVPALVATKIMFGIGILLPAILLSMVLFPLMGWGATFLSSVLYIYAPYHAVQIYVRGAVGEYWELIFWPLILYALIWSGNTPRKKNVMLIGAVGLFGSIVSHTLLGYATALFVAIGLGLYWAFRYMRGEGDRNALFVQAKWYVLGLGTSAFFWLPALFEMRFTDVAAQVSATANYLDHFVCVGQLWSAPWGYGGSAPGCTNDGLSFMLGKIHILLSVAVILWWVSGRLKHISKAYLVLSGILTAAGIFLTLPVSAFVWRTLPMFAYFQYPWRFLALAVFGLSLLAGASVLCIRHPIFRSIASLSIAAVVVGMSAKWFVPQYLYVPTTALFESSRDLRWRASKISDEYLPKEIVRPDRESHVVSATIESRQPIVVSTILATAVEYQSAIESTSAASVNINIASFPGWRYYVNGKEVSPRIVGGLPVVSVGPGQSIFMARFTDTAVRTIGNIVSGLSFVVLTCIYVKQKETKR